MGTIIGLKASVEKIEAHLRTALRNGVARGEAIGAAAQARLGDVVGAIDMAAKALADAQVIEDNIRASMLAEDARSDLEIGNVRDQMFQALGRPRGSTALAQVFPEGVATYTKGDP